MFSKILFQTFKNNLKYSPIFVIGQGRSGTSAIHRAVGLHPKIAFKTTESPLIKDIGAIIYNYKFGENSTYFIHHNQLNEKKLYEAFANINLGYAIGNTISFKNYSKDVLRQLIKYKYLYLNKTRYVAKTAPDSRAFFGLRELYPNSQFIYIYRNGFDQINSAMNHKTFRGKSFEHYCDEYNKHVEKYMYVWDQKEVFKLKHEHLTEYPESKLKEVFRFLNLKPNPRPLKFLTNNLVSPLSDPRTKRNLNVQEEFKNRPPVWQYWTEEQKAIFKDKCQYAMNLLGYEIPY